ncbi:MAG: hypothetical protein RRZ42_08585 [Oscillospiraceae bacterium]
MISSALPDGDINGYKYIGGAFIHDPLPPPAAPSPTAPTAQDRTEAQLAYTAMMTDTLLEA